MPNHIMSNLSAASTYSPAASTSMIPSEVENASIAPQERAERAPVEDGWDHDDAPLGCDAERGVCFAPQRDGEGAMTPMRASDLVAAELEFHPQQSLEKLDSVVRDESMMGDADDANSDRLTRMNITNHFVRELGAQTPEKLGALLNDETALRDVLTQAIDSHEFEQGIGIAGTTVIGQRSTEEVVESVVEGLKDHYVAKAEQEIAHHVRADLGRAEARLASLGSSREERLAAVAQMVAESSSERDLARGLRQFGVEGRVNAIAAELWKADASHILDGTSPAANKAEAGIARAIDGLKEGVEAMRTQIGSDEATAARGHLLTRNPIYGPNRERVLAKYGVSLSKSGKATAHNPAGQAIAGRMTDHKIQGLAEDTVKNVCGALANNVVSSVLFNGLGVAMAKSSLDAARGARLGASRQDSVAHDRTVVRAQAELDDSKRSLVTGVVTQLPGVKAALTPGVDASKLTKSEHIIHASEMASGRDVAVGFMRSALESEVFNIMKDASADYAVQGR